MARQLYRVTVSTKGKIVIGGIIITIARLFGVEPNPVDKVYGFEWLDQTAFELMNCCKVETGCLC